MKKIINGKVYNTDTAECVGEWDNGCYGNDFNYCEESLYRKKTGEFFLYGSGGALSKYAESRGTNSWGSGSTIKPLKLKEAQEWAEERLDADDYEKIFGEVSEDNGRTMMSISLANDEAEIIRRRAQEAGMSLSAYIVMRCAE